MLKQSVLICLIVTLSHFLVNCAPAYDPSGENENETISRILESLIVRNSKSDSETEVFEGNHNGNSDKGPSATLEFLRKFGYLEPPESNNSETLYSEEKVKEAVKLMQKYGALPETGLLDSETLSLLTRPRCGVPDILKTSSRRKRFALGSKGWNKRRLTYRVENWSPKLTGEDVHEDIRKATETWASYSHLSFVNKSNEKTNENIDIAFSFGKGQHGDRYPFDGPGGTLAHAFYTQNTPGISGDVHFDMEENWYSPSSKNSSDKNKRRHGISFLDVAVHELGHSLGIGHSHSKTSVMFPYYQTPASGQPQLDHDDIMALYHLYIVRKIDDDDVTKHSTWSPPLTTTTRKSTSTTRRPTISTTRTTTKTTEIDRSTSTTSRTTTTTPSSNIPTEQELCGSDKIDAISFIRNELFVFIGEYMWRFRNPGELVGGSYPAKFSRLFPILQGVSKIDAAFERESDGKIVFISGRLYWTFDGVGGDDGPHPLSDFKLPKDLDGIDAAFVWGKNKMTYFFKNNIYWKYDEKQNKIEDGYPKNIEKWRGVPANLTSVIKYRDEKTYFFKGKEVWKFDDQIVHTEDGYPKKSFEMWFNC